MRISRLISRRFWRLITYLFLGLLVIIVPATLTLNKYGNGSKASRADSPEFPGAAIAIDNLLIGVPKFDDAWPYGQGEKKDWHDHEFMRQEKARSGPGEQGAPMKLPTDEETKAKEDQLYRVNGYDGLVSDYIALNRSIKDIRHPGCRTKNYFSRLPTATIILPFHDEHYSVLLRSCYSIVNRSPASLLKEIILVDDASTKPELLVDGKLETYLKKELPIVRIVHTKKREGLIRARQIGAVAAGKKAEVIIFLDAHSEANHNWLPPLLEPIAEDYRTAVCPFVDVVDCDTFEYKPQDEGARGSFDWEFNYKRLPLTKKDRANPTEPFNSPVMAGGYFGISTRWFWELGGYDEGLDIWGGEQYELSFKIWQCHGRMVDAPCSRVGHIYRCKYTPFPNPGVGDFISRNYKRVAEVWMDEYKEHLYKRRPGLVTADPGDLTKQKAVRERLKCKPFKWFMTEVAFDQDRFYPANEPADGAKGHLKPAANEKLCVDAQYRDKNQPIGMRECGMSGSEQHFRLTWYNDIRPKDRSQCFDVSTSVDKAPVVTFPCHGMLGNQWFKFDAQKRQLFHPVSHLCLDMDVQSKELFMRECDANKPSQQWIWDEVNADVLKKWETEPRKIDVE